MNLGSKLIVIFGFIIVVVVSYMLVGQIEKENESGRILEVDDSLELIRNCQAGKYVKWYALGHDFLTVEIQNNDNCIIQIEGEVEGGYSKSSCKIPLNEIQNFQGMKSFYYEPEGNFVKYCETIESGTVWDRIP